jgi:hypothetical protein
VAGAEGVDCDGDGREDLRPGAPLVCVTTAGFITGVGAALAALPDLAELSVSAQGPAAAGAGLLVQRQIDVLAPAPVPLTVPVACPADGAGERSADVTARLSGIPLAAARIELRCLALPVAAVRPAPLEEPVPAPPPAAVPVAAGVAVQPPQPPPPPAQPAGQPQPLGQGVAQPVAAAQEDEQVDLVLVGADLDEDPQPATGGDEMPAGLLPFTAGLMTAAAGWAAMRRPQAAPALARR